MRGDLTDEEWAIIGGLLPPERGRWSRPSCSRVEHDFGEPITVTHI
ncbi:hypothetical protein [Komagataeibacter europaeus]|nr:hypothetical protein [Komagataeibacter europaeus]